MQITKDFFYLVLLIDIKQTFSFVQKNILIRLILNKFANNQINYNN